MRALERIDPRRSLAAAIGWLVIALSLSLVVAANVWLHSVVRQALLEQYGQRLDAASLHVGAELETALVLRLQAVSTLAAVLSGGAPADDRGALHRALDAAHREVPDLSWMAVTDANGDIVAATDPAVVGSNIYQYAWMSQGLDIAWVEEGVVPGAPAATASAAPTAAAPMSRASVSATRAPDRFLKLTAPMRNADGAIAGVLAARLGWSRVQALADGIRAEPGQWLLIDRDGIVRVGPPSLLGQDWRAMLGAITPFDRSVAGLGTDARDLPRRIQVRRLFGRHPYLLAGTEPAPGSTLGKLGWRVVVIQPVAAVTAFATDVEWQITATLMLLGAIAAVAGVSVARRLTRRLSVIARSADALLAGRAHRIDAPTGRDEAARLGGALDRLLTTLQRERDELRELNAVLDDRVAQRTEEIRRLADEARDAAVVRERLRLARDLHDTLAHSMMAMLTEIRLLKRLATTRPDELPDELVRAEQAAREGLHEARLAIAQLRSNPVRDVGLGPALAELATRFGERTGIAVRFVGDDGIAAQLADDRGETLFRMTEEALRNVERHAGAGEVVVSLHGAPSAATGLALSIEDDGVGFDPQDVGVGHYGLDGLREQAAGIGAALSIGRRPGGGTLVRLVLG